MCASMRSIPAHKPGEARPGHKAGETNPGGQASLGTSTHECGSCCRQVRTLVWIQAAGPPCRASVSVGTRSSTSGSALGCRAQGGVKWQRVSRSVWGGGAGGHSATAPAALSLSPRWAAGQEGRRTQVDLVAERLHKPVARLAPAPAQIWKPCLQQHSNVPTGLKTSMNWSTVQWSQHMAKASRTVRNKKDQRFKPHKPALTGLKTSMNWSTVQWNQRMRKMRSARPWVTSTREVLSAKRPALMSRCMGARAGVRWGGMRGAARARRACRKAGRQAAARDACCTPHHQVVLKNGHAADGQGVRSEEAGARVLVWDGRREKVGRQVCGCGTAAVWRARLGEQQMQQALHCHPVTDVPEDAMRWASTLACAHLTQKQDGNASSAATQGQTTAHCRPQRAALLSQAASPLTSHGIELKPCMPTGGKQVRRASPQEAPKA